MKCERCGIEDAGVREYAQVGEGYGTGWEPVFDGAHYVGDLRRWAHDDSDDCAECIAALQAAITEAEARARVDEREECAHVAESHGEHDGAYCHIHIAVAIRAREEVQPLKDALGRWRNPTCTRCGHERHWHGLVSGEHPVYGRCDYTDAGRVGADAWCSCDGFRPADPSLVCRVPTEAEAADLARTEPEYVRPVRRKP